MTLPNSVQTGDPGHVEHHNAIKALLDERITAATASSTYLAALGVVRPGSAGVIGNGTTDDRAAIQALYDAMPSSGGLLVFNPGLYAVAGPLIQSNPYVNVLFMPGARLVNISASDYAMRIQTGITLDRQPVITGLSIIGNGEGGPNHGVQIDGAFGVTLRDYRGENVARYLDLTATVAGQFCEGTTVENGHAQDVSKVITFTKGAGTGSFSETNVRGLRANLTGFGRFFEVSSGGADVSGLNASGLCCWFQGPNSRFMVFGEGSVATKIHITGRFEDLAADKTGNVIFEIVGTPTEHPSGFQSIANITGTSFLTGDSNFWKVTSSTREVIAKTQTTTVTAGTANGDLADLAPGNVMQQARPLRITVHVPVIYSDTAGDGFKVQLLRGGAVVAEVEGTSPAAFRNDSQFLSYREPPAQTAWTYTVRIVRNGTGTVTAGGTASNPAQLVVEEL